MADFQPTAPHEPAYDSSTHLCCEWALPAMAYLVTRSNLHLHLDLWLGQRVLAVQALELCRCSLYTCSAATGLHTFQPTNLPTHLPTHPPTYLTHLPHLPTYQAWEARLAAGMPGGSSVCWRGFVFAPGALLRIHMCLLLRIYMCVFLPLAPCGNTCLDHIIYICVCMYACICMHTNIYIQVSRRASTTRTSSTRRAARTRVTCTDT